MLAFDAVVILDNASELSLCVLARDWLFCRLLCLDTALEGGVTGTLCWPVIGAERLPLILVAMRTAEMVFHSNDLTTA